MSGEEVLEELEALEAILEETIEVVSSTNNRPTDLAIQINPLTEGEQEKQYVSLTLSVHLPPEYPGCPPKIQVRNPRGLEDGAVNGLLSDMEARCDEYQGCPVLFELIELAREFLTTRNVPVCKCIICLNNIEENDEFTKTECLHFFHKRCLGRYITNMQESYEAERAEAAINNKGSTPKELELVCPVCREGIHQYKYNLAELMLAPPPVLEPAEEVYTIDPNIRKIQEQMKTLYIQQKNKGGIIDVEAEEKKYLILTNHGETFAELSPTDYQLVNQTSEAASSTSSSPSHQPNESKKNRNWRGRGRGFRGRGYRGKR